MSYSIEPNYYQQYIFPPRLEDLLSPGHPARYIRAYVSGLNLLGLGFKLSLGPDGRPHYAETMKLSIWLYGYFRKVYSTRGMEYHCKNDIGFMWLSGLYRPDHSTLWKFFDDNRSAIKKLFKKITELAIKVGLVDFAIHAVDGTKIQGKVSTRTSWKYKSLERMLKDVDESINEIMEKIESANEEEQERNYELPEELQDQEKLKEKIESALQEMDRINRENLHKDDKDARMMKTGNNNKQMGYNCQAVVDEQSGLIVAQDVTNDENDTDMLVPMIEKVEETTGRQADETVADAGYYSPKQSLQTEEKGIEVLVNINKQILPETDENKFHKSRFTFDETTDEFICPLGKRLTFERVKNNRQKKRKLRVYRCHHKSCCPESMNCSREKRGRSIEMGSHFLALQRQIRKQKEPGNKEILARRKQIIEPVFGTIKENLRFRRFTVSGLDKVRTQWSLVCTVFNLRKLFKVWKEGKLVF